MGKIVAFIVGLIAISSQQGLANAYIADNFINPLNPPAFIPCWGGYVPIQWNVANWIPYAAQPIFGTLNSYPATFVAPTADIPPGGDWIPISCVGGTGGGYSEIWTSSSKTYTFWFGKLYNWSDYFCVYDRTYPAVATWAFQQPYVIDPRPRASNYGCSATYNGAELINFFGALPPPVPPLDPIVNFVNGLTCQTDYIASMSGATWYNFGSLPMVFNADDPAVPDLAWVEVGTTGYDGDRDVIGWSPAGTWSLLGTWSFMYPGTSTGILMDPINWFGLLAIDTIRWGNKTPYNLFQFFGTQNIAFNRAGTFTVELSNWVQYWNVALTSSGWTTVGALANTNDYITTLWVQHLGRFRWFRIGSGPMVPKTSCSINFNICEWSYEGADLSCVSAENAAWVDFAGCWVTGSGSVYGSGACVPLTNSSGAIIPPPPVTGGYVTLDWSGNVVGTVEPVPSPTTFFAGVFECGISDQDSWYVVIGKSLTCPYTVMRKFLGKLWDSVGTAQNTSNQLWQTTNAALSGAQMAWSGSAYTWTNLLVKSVLEKDAMIKTNSKVLIFIWSLTAIFMVFVILVAVSIIKNR